MKIFYRKDYITWSKLNSFVDKDLAVPCEIIIPDGMISSEKTDCENAIRLWNEQKYGDRYPYRLILGESNFDALLDIDTEDYIYKIDEAVGDEKEIVLAIDGSESVFVQEFIEHFLMLKEERGFRLHILVNLSVDTYGNPDRMLLRYLNHIQMFESVAFFNHIRLRDFRSDRNLNTSERIEFEEICEEIFAQELNGILKLAKDLDTVDDKHLWLYDWSEGAYQLIKIMPQDLEDRPRYKKPFQEIAPNDGKETCKQLRELRDQFRRRHSLKLREKPCNHTGECKGTCPYCDDYAMSLWNEVYQSRYDKTVERYCSEPAAICGISRLRQDTDGYGIRTLVIMDGCHMNCKYCINKSVLNKGHMGYVFTDELYEMIKKDNLYFEMTGGGVTFGGGEPLVYPEFIGVFKSNNPQINVAVETSLNVPFESVSALTFLVDYWIVDVKDMNSDIYQNYTGLNNFAVKANLKYLLNHIPAEKILCRVPLIPGFNTLEDVEKSVKELTQMGAVNIERFEYS